MNQGTRAVLAALSFLLASSVVAAPTQEAGETAASAPEELTWPRTYTYPKGEKLVLYQPQVTAWPEHTRLKALVALAFSSAEEKTPALGPSSSRPTATSIWSLAWFGCPASRSSRDAFHRSMTRRRPG